MHATDITKVSAKEHLILELLSKNSEMFGMMMIEASNGDLKVGTIYPTLQRMEERKLIHSWEVPRKPPEKGNPRRMYKVTDYGRLVFGKNCASSALFRTKQLSIEEAAELLYVSESTVLAWIESNEIEFAEGSSGEVLIDRDGLLTDETRALFDEGIRCEVACYDGAFSQGAEWFRKAIESNPNYGRAHYHLGRNLLCRFAPGEAIEPLKRSIQLNENAWHAWADLGLCYYQVQQFVQAVGCFREVVRLEPANIRGMKDLGKALFLAGQSADKSLIHEALDILKTVHVIDPKCYETASLVMTMLTSSYMDTFNLANASTFAQDVGLTHPTILKNFRDQFQASHN